MTCWPRVKESTHRPSTLLVLMIMAYVLAGGIMPVLRSCSAPNQTLMHPVPMPSALPGGSLMIEVRHGNR